MSRRFIGSVVGSSVLACLFTSVGCSTGVVSDTGETLRIRGPQGADLALELVTIADVGPDALRIRGAIDGEPLSLDIDGLDANAASISAVSESGVEYTLELGEHEANITIDYGATAQTITVFDTLGLAHLEAITDFGDAQQIAADGALRHSSAHAAVLGVIGHLAQHDERLAPLRGRLSAITASIVEHADGDHELTPDGLGLAGGRGPAAAQPDDADQAEGGYEGGGDEGGGADGGADQDATQEKGENCKPEVERPWKAGDSLSLGMGPVTVEASLVRVEGTSICDLQDGVLKTETTGSVNKSFTPAGQNECQSGYESVYRLAADKAADAEHVRCCWPNGKTDEAVAGDLKLSIGGFTLSIKGNSAHNDMASKAHAKITADIKICVDEDWGDEGYGVSETWTAEASIT